MFARRRRRPGGTKLVGYSPAHDQEPTKTLSEIYSRAVIAISLSRSEALAGIAQVVLQSPARTVFNHRRSNMMKFPSTLDEESLLTYEVSDEGLETAGGNEIAGNYKLAACTGLTVCPS